MFNLFSTEAFPTNVRENIPWFRCLAGIASIVLLTCALCVPATQAQENTVTINKARDTDGTTVTFEGKVTRAYGNFIRMQDESGPTGASGIVIRQTSGSNASDVQTAISDGEIRPGTVLRITGSVSFFAGLAQVSDGDLQDYTIVSQEDPPAPQTITLDELADASGDDPGGEIYESELVRVEGLEFSASGTFSTATNYDVSDGNGNASEFRVQGTDETELEGTPIPGIPIDYEGVVGQFHGFDFVDEPDTGYQLIPVRVSDLNLPLASFAGRFETVEEGGEVTIEIQGQGFQNGDVSDVTVEAVGGTADASTDLSAFNAPATATLSGEGATATVTVSSADDTDEEGVERLEFALKTDANSLASAPKTFTLWIKDDPRAQTTLFSGTSGDALRDDLQNRYGDPSTLGYDTEARDRLYGQIFNQDGTLTAFYSGATFPLDPADGSPTSQAGALGINTEHVYPQFSNQTGVGAGEEPARSNMHILVPVRGAVNSARSANPFGEVADEEATTWYAGTSSQTQPPVPLDRNRWSEVGPGPEGETRFEPRESVKGDVARAIFYFDTLYGDLTDSEFVEVQDSTLLQWHLSDPVSAAEVERNLAIASFQDNKVNPFVFDSTLVNRVYQLGGVAPVPPTTAVAKARRGKVTLRWDASTETDVTEYRIYRSTTSISAPADDLRLSTVPSSDTSYTDENLDPGRSYFYRVTAADGTGESLVSNLTEAPSIPLQQTPSVNATFGRRDNSRSYRLVALPGTGSQPLASVLSGESSTDWSAYWDDGTGEDFFQKYDGSNTFEFAPGRGFWVLADEPFRFDGTVDTVPLNDDGQYTIPLHEGWNIISNPLAADVGWERVQAANAPAISGTEDETIGSLWAWSGGFIVTPSFKSAASGDAYYFRNNVGLDSLRIPYPGAQPEGQEAEKSTLQKQQQRLVTLEALVDDQPVSTVQVGFQKEASSRGANHETAPPMRFQPVGLRLEGDLSAQKQEENKTRSTWLARTTRRVDAGGASVDVQLKAADRSVVQLRARGTNRIGNRAVRLINKETGEVHTLQDEKAASVQTPAQTTPLRLLVGTESYVRQESRQSTPSQVKLLPNTPNPFSKRTTVKYMLPERMDVTVDVYDLLGRRISTLQTGSKGPGLHRLVWEAEGVANGVYLLRLQTKGQIETRKVVVVQ